MILNIITGKFYIGRSSDLHKRFEQHRTLLSKNKHHSVHLQRSWNKHGGDNFKFLVIKEIDDKEEMRNAEQILLDKYRDALYNVGRNAKDGGDLISYHPNREEIINKMTESLNERFSKMTKEEKVKMYGKFGAKNGMYGKNHTDESKAIISEKSKKYYETNESHNNGKSLDELYSAEKANEIRRKLSESAKKKTGDKNPFYGKHHTEETKEKLSNTHRGRKPTNQRSVLIEFVEYPSVTEASRQLDVCPATIIHRIKSKNRNYINYYYKDELQNAQ